MRAYSVIGSKECLHLAGKARSRRRKLTASKLVRMRCCSALNKVLLCAAALRLVVIRRGVSSLGRRR
jgi:hypothetical protein